MTAAELVAEAKRVIAEANATGLDEQERAAAARVVAGFTLCHGPRLVALVEAAVEMRRVLGMRAHVGSNLGEALAAFDALARLPEVPK